MKKLFLSIVLILVTVAPVSAQKFNLGAEWNFEPLGGVYSGAAATFRLPELPIQWGLSFSLGSNATNIGLTGDYWLYNSPLISFVNLYAGPGVFVGVALNNSNSALNLGVRVPFGLYIKPLQPLELFLELAPAAGLVLSNPLTFKFYLQSAFGIRFWF